MIRLTFLLLLFTSLTYSQMIIDSHRFGACDSDPNDIFPTGNAASECDGEANSTSGWGVFTSTNASVVSTRSGYALESEADSGTYGRATYDITVENASTYDVTFDYRVSAYPTSGMTQGYFLWQGVVTSPSHTMEKDGVWRRVTETVTTNSTTMEMRFYSNGNAAVGTGNKIEIDNLRIVKQ